MDALQRPWCTLWYQRRHASAVLHTLCLNCSDQPALTVPFLMPRESSGRGYSLRDVIGARQWESDDDCFPGAWTDRWWNSFNTGAAVFTLRQPLRGAGSLWNLQRSKTGHRLSATRHDAVTKQYSLMQKGSSSSGNSARLCCVSRTLWQVWANQILSWIQVATILIHKYQCVFRICFPIQSFYERPIVQQQR